MTSAVSINRAILRNARMTQRRSLFEMLGIFTYVIAVVLSVFGILNWTSQPYFVASCTVIWILFSLSVVTRIWWSDKKEKVLEIPDAWDEPIGMNRGESRIAFVSRSVTAQSDYVEGVKTKPSIAQPGTEIQTAADSESSTAEPGFTQTSSFDSEAPGAIQTGLRSVRLQQYRQERLSRYQQKRRSRRAVASNLAIYQKQPGTCVSNGN